MLDFGGFNIKQWIISGHHRKESEEIKLMNAESEKVLGLVWKPINDIFTFRVRLKFSRRTKHKCPEVKLAENVEEIPKMLTKRMVLSQVAGPIRTHCSLHFRNVHVCQGNQSNSEERDRALSSNMRQQWSKL